MRTPDFWNHRSLVAQVLAPLGVLYGASVARKARDAKPFRARAKVICVGNLTAGGSGKTPVALALAQLLLAQGKNVFFLTRGYGGRKTGPTPVHIYHNAADVGDEALLLARTAPTIVARDRAAGAALADQLGADIIIMDDGHQNFALAKDLSLVVVDGEYGFGNGLMIPAGPLREPVSQGLARADAVIVMGSEGLSPEDGTPDLEGYGGPVLHGRLVPQDDMLRGQRLFAFAGIGRPEKFIASLNSIGALVTGSQFFPDHHVFQRGEIAGLKTRAGGAQLVTTEKDFVRLSDTEREGVAVLKVTAIFAEGIAPLLARLSA